MAYGQNDPATDLRISRLSLLKAAATLFQGKTSDPSVVLNAAIDWEEWVYSHAPAQSNGVAAPAAPAVPVCSECGNPLTPVKFKTGNTWSIEHLATQGQTKFGRVYCKQHYFGKKPASA